MESRRSCGPSWRRSWSRRVVAVGRDGAPGAARPARRDAAMGGAPGGWEAGAGTSCSRAADRTVVFLGVFPVLTVVCPLRECDRERLRRDGLPTVSLGRGRDPRRRKPVPAARRAARRVGGPSRTRRFPRCSRSRSPRCRSRPRVCLSWPCSSSSRWRSRGCSACATGGATVAAAVAAGHLRHPDGERDALVRTAGRRSWRFRDRSFRSRSASV